MFPRLDVDFHLAPFVDERDHLGAAQARVEIGLPFFEQPREFWARPLRPVKINMRGDNGGRSDILLRPVGAPADHLLLLINELQWLGLDALSKEKPSTKWEQQWENCGLPVAHLRHGQFARCWRHPNLPLATRLSVSQNLGKSDRDARLFPLQMSQEHAHNYEDPLQLSLDELLDWPTKGLHDSLQHQFCNPNSELSLTWEWIQIPRSQRFQTFFARPQWNGFLPLIKCVLINEAWHVPQITESGAVWKFLENPTSFFQAESMPPQFFEPTRLNAWSHAILDFYQRREVQRPTPKLMSLNLYKSRPLRCAAPSHHEMLEARLQLHAWARANLTHADAQRLIALDK